MSGKIGANEVLEFAEQMERNAARFYRKAAGLCEDRILVKLFVDLARWERQHARAFADMRNQLTESNREPARYAIDIDESPAQSPLPLTFGDDEFPSGRLVDGATKAEVLRAAIRREKDSIAYYTGLREFVLGHHNIQVIKAIIREERRHVRILVQSLEHVPGRREG